MAPFVVRSVVAGMSAVLLGACGFTGETVEPNSSDEGIQATGRIDGSPVAISRASPIVVVGDCDPIDGPDEDLCIEARTIDGLTVTLVIENRDALVAGTTVPVGRASCVDGCDTIMGEVIARVEIGADDVAEVTGGRFEVDRADDRFIASFDITLPFGDRLDGRFDVAERLRVENPDGVVRPADDGSDSTGADDDS